MQNSTAAGRVSNNNWNEHDPTKNNKNRAPNNTKMLLKEADDYLLLAQASESVVNGPLHVHAGGFGINHALLLETA